MYHTLSFFRSIERPTMCRILFVWLLLAAAPVFTLFAQAPVAGGAYAFQHAACFTEQEHTTIEAEVERNVFRLQAEGRLVQERSNAIVYFSWPLRLKAGLTDPSYYGISNFVDEANGSGTLDYNCGSRTYDGHNGTDIFLWPFPWHKMNNNEVEIIAAASGTIVARYDGNFDQQCAWNNNAQGNGIVVQHNDGSRAWYWHMKKFSLTTKGVGATVSAGEYLGVVGSSGISTGPHLHFEVYNSNNQVIDPWGGPCNYKGGQSWWSGQKPYTDPKVNKLMTHHTMPSMPNCGPDVLNASNTFQAGDLVYFATYYRDQQFNALSSYSVIQPNGVVWKTWTHNAPASYTASWWIWNHYLPSNAQAGTWKFRVTFNGQTTTHDFTVGACPAPSTAQISATNVTANSATLNCSLSGYAQYDWRYRPSSAGTWIDLNSTSVNYVQISNLAAATTYEFQVSVRCANGSWSTWSGSKTFTTLNNSSPCSNATTLSCGASVSGNNFSGSNNFNAYGCTNWLESGKERIYRVVTTSSGNLTATLSNLTADLDVFILNACGSNNCIAFGDNTATAVNAPPGTYFIVIDGYLGASGSFSLNVTCPAESSGNNEPCGASVLSVGNSCVFQSLTTANATPTVNPPAPSVTNCPTTNMRDIWVRFTMPASGKVSVNTTAGTLNDAVVAAYSGSSCNGLSLFGCIDDNANGDPMPDFTVTASPGSTVWLRIWGYMGSTGTFNICIQAVSAFSGEPTEAVLSAEVAAETLAASSRSVAPQPKPDDRSGALSVFPSPAVDMLTLHWSLPDAAAAIDELVLLDMQGRQALQLLSPVSESSDAFQYTVPVSGLVPGVYVAKVRSGGAVQTARFVKQ